MPNSSLTWRGSCREISGATRAFFYSLLDNTASDFALVPPSAAHDSLCSSCSRIPFDEIFCTTDNDTNITFDIGTFSEIEHRRDCVFCSFVKNVCLVAFPWHWIRRFQGYPEQFKIIGGPSAWRAFAVVVPPPEFISPCATLQAPEFFDEYEEYDESFLSAWLLSYVPSPQTKPIAVRLRTKGEVINGELDVELIKSWVTACTTSHNICKQKLSIPELHTYVRPNFIDAITKTIVPGEKVTDYVALSYVWGPDKPEVQCRHQETDGGELAISRLPNGNPPRYAFGNSKHLGFSHPCQVVKDAMELVMKIGFRYLWVDEYCIGQGPRQREIHISQMDRIYEGAVLTICALSGTHKHLGLPGISSPLQVPPQPYVDLDSKRIIATRLSDSLRYANSSPWGQRAWTLQEASLSRRLLCFTDQSVFWVCQEQIFHDAVNCLDLGLEGHASISPSNSFMEFPFHLDEFDGRFDMCAFRSILLSYTRRHLTKDSDALAAISGLLARITKLTGEEFCFGHPKRDLIRSLVWKSKFSLRRKDFPSWSWLGWRGTINLIMWQENHPDVSRPDIFLIDIEGIPSNTHYVVEKRIAKVIEYPEEKSTSPILKISSQVARFEAIKVVRKGEDFQDSNEDESEGTSTASDDLWCLNIAHSHDLPCTHAGVGWAFTHSGCFTADPETSLRLEDVSCQVEFVLLVHWQEYIKDKDSSWVALDTNHLFTEDDSGVGNLVLALLILENQDGKAERIALVPIPYESWAAASPEEMFIELV
jgi:hypothetical protein